MNGLTIEDPEQIHRNVVSFFSSLYEQQAQVLHDHLFNITGPLVSASQNAILTSVPSELEVKEAGFALEKTSSLGPDGFTRAFFTMCWSIVSFDVINSVQDFFISARLL